MLKFITWGNYIAGSAALLACYYAVVLLAYYRSEIQSLITGSLKQGHSATVADAPEAQFEELESIVHEIDGILEQAGKEATKDQLLPQLKRKLANYGGLRIPAYRVAVFNHITTQAEELCGVRISAKELEEEK